jgi:gliding-associated putative ABC transporter substrate-binding component GldG
MTTKKNIRSSVLLLVAVLVALNVVAALYFFRVDLSEGQRFTLSDYSREVVSSLEEPVTVKVFFSEDLGPQYNQNRTYIHDMLEDYKAYSGGQFHFEVQDARDKEAFETEASRFRIRPVQAQAVENDQITVKMIYMGLAFLAGDRTESVPFLADVNGLEYLITSTIRRLTVDELERVGILTGHGEASMGQPGQPGSELALLQELLMPDYRIEAVDLCAVDEIDAELSTLLWIAPKEQVEKAELYKLDQYLMRGGHLAIFANGVTANLQTQEATELDLGLNEFLTHYGLKINQNLVTDSQCGVVQMRQGGGGLMSLFPITMKYPPFVDVRNFNEDHPASRDLVNAQFFFPASLDTMAFANARAAGAVVVPIMSSSEHCELQSGVFNIAPLERLDGQVLRSRFTLGPQVLAASVEGAFKSFFSGQPLPEGISIEASRSSEGKPCRMAAVADGNFVSGQYAQAQNLMLAQNIVDWMSLDSGLIGIRTKAITMRPLNEISAEARKAVKWANILGVPIFIIIFGLLRYRLRRRRAGQV